MELPNNMSYACDARSSKSYHLAPSLGRVLPLRVACPMGNLTTRHLPCLKVTSQAFESDSARSGRTMSEPERRPAEDWGAAKVEKNGTAVNHVNGAASHKVVVPVVVDGHEGINNSTVVESPAAVDVDVDVRVRRTATVPVPKETINGYHGLMHGPRAPHLNGQPSTTIIPPTTAQGLGILEFLKGKRVLITGATGFLAKVLVEKILRVQPDVGQLFLLIKAADTSHAKARIQNELLDTTLFKKLRGIHGTSYQDFIDSKLSPIVGNLANDNLGLDAAVAAEIQGTVDIVINSAASTTFDERYDHALNLNTKGAERVTKFASQCPKLQLLLHVSTAFVNGERKGVVKERSFKIGCSIANENRTKGGNLLPDIDIDAEVDLVNRKLSEVSHGRQVDLSSENGFWNDKNIEKEVHQAMKDFGMERAKKYGWQDTYVFTKALGEMLVDRGRGQVPVVIIRPSVVESSFRDPFPGWMEGNRMMDPIIISYGKGQLPGFLVDPQSVLDVVPVDMVANAMLAAMARHANHPGLEVYQVASSVLNPLVFCELARMSREHFEEQPFVDKFGKPLPIAKLRLFDTMEGFMDAVTTCPQVLQGLAPAANNEKLPLRRQQLILKVKEQAAYLANLYRPYTFYAGRFDTTKTRELLACLSSHERGVFGFDVGEIDWDSYIKTVHIPGLRKHVLKGRGSTV